VAYSYKVEIEGNDGFILDTDLLDTGLLGYLTTDVTSYVRSISCKRGKSTNLDRFTAGQLSVVFDNRDRTFDPTYTSSTLYGAIVPRRRIRFYAGYDSSSLHSQFVGFIDDWNFDYDVSGDSTATASASDGFTVLANQTFTMSAPPAEDSDVRARRVLTNSQVAWPLENYFETGAAITLNSVSFTGTALEYLLQIADSEQGLIYVNRSGVLTFLGWNYFASPIIGPDIWFSDGSFVDGLPFSGLATNYGTEQLYNYVTVTGSAGTVTSQDTTSQITYQIASYELPVLTAGTAQMQSLADSLVNTYKNPILRVSAIDTPIDGYDRANGTAYTAAGSAGVSSVFQADFGYIVDLYWRPNGIAPSSSSTGVLIGKTITVTPSGCDVSLELGPYQFRSVI
jgi:hypothetical protein